MAEKPVPLTEKTLLQKVKELAHLTKRETAKECGYYSFTKDNHPRTSLSSFYDALLEAKGINYEFTIDALQCIDPSPVRG